MKVIKLTQGKFAIVDDDDYEMLSKYKWCFNYAGYAERRISKSLGGGIMRMHRLIMNAQKGHMVDHINMNGLDNRKFNLRICTKSENMRNRNKTKVNKSGYKGVIFDKSLWPLKKPWKAQIKINQKNVNLGRFSSKEGAAEAYNKAAKIYYKEFANLNKI